MVIALMCYHLDRGGISCFRFILVLDAPGTQVVSNLTYSHYGKGNTIRFRPKVCVLAPESKVFIVETHSRTYISPSEVRIYQLRPIIVSASKN